MLANDGIRMIEVTVNSRLSLGNKAFCRKRGSIKEKSCALFVMLKLGIQNIFAI
jgi:hypothetical protein